jgi:FixJ family two-component response regulator
MATTRTITLGEHDTALLAELVAELTNRGVAFTVNLSCGDWVVTITGA